MHRPAHLSFTLPLVSIFRHHTNNTASSSCHNAESSTARGICAASVTKRAAYVIANGSISLDAKLGIFTVRDCRSEAGTVIPETVVFVSGGCYHIAAAKQAIGMRDDVQRRKLNLTQLHKNKRNRPDKISGRKRPRAADVDVITVPDADPSVASAATGHADGVEPDDDPDDAVIIRDDICHTCDSANPPARKNRKVHQIDWLQCDKCPRWYHVVCVGVCNTAAEYTWICASEHCPRLLTVV